MCYNRKDLYYDVLNFLPSLYHVESLFHTFHSCGGRAASLANDQFVVLSVGCGCVSDECDLIQIIVFSTYSIAVIMNDLGLQFIVFVLGFEMLWSIVWVLFFVKPLTDIVADLVAMEYLYRGIYCGH